MNIVRLGFVPTYRFGYTEWCHKMRVESLAALQKVAGAVIIAPEDGPIDPLSGCVPHGAVNNLDEAEALAEYFQLRKVDGVILCPLDFGDERSSVKVAELIRKPVLLYATKEPPALNDTPGMGRVSDSYCGNLSIASGLYRRKIAFRYAGIFFPDEPDLLKEFIDFARAVGVVKSLNGARIGQIGTRPDSFETVGYDEIAMIQKFGQNVIHAELSDLTHRALSMKDDEPGIQEILEDMNKVAAVITVSDLYMLKAAKLENAFREFATQNHLSAMAIQCWSSVQRLIGISVCEIYGRLTDSGLPTACETDILGALSMLATYGAALGETMPHFIDWTIQHRSDPNKLLAWHCGNAPASLAANPGSVAIRSRTDMQGVLPVDPQDSQEGLYQFQVKPGKVTFCRLAEYDNQWKMLIAGGEIIPSDEFLAGTWSWVQVNDHAKLYRTLVEEGFIHHASMVHGDQKAALLQACKYLDIQAVVVD